MKKKILVSAVVALSMFGFSAMAQNNNPASCEAQACEKVGCNKTCDIKEFKGGPRCDFKRKKGDPFVGINLSDAQKAKLAELRTKQADKVKARVKAIKAEKQRNDSMRMAERRESKRAYLEEVKEIIGPDNYVTYLENIVVEQGAPGRGGHHQMNPGRIPGKVKAFKGDRKGKCDAGKGQCADNAKYKNGKGEKKLL